MTDKNKRILITGITGFIGSHLGLKLKSIGYDVYGVTRVSSSRDNIGLQPFLKEIGVSTADITDYQSTNKAIKSINPDIVIHLAATSSIVDSIEKSILDLKTNVLGTMNIVNALIDLPNSKEKRIIYASSNAIYGAQETQPVKEDVIVDLRNPYTIDKACAESHLRFINSIYGIRTIMMRPTNTYGRKLNSSFFVEYLVSNMLAGKQIHIGLPDTVRDYMYVDDHINGYVKAIEHDEINCEAFNLGTGVGTSNRDLAFKVADLIGYDKESIVLGEYDPSAAKRPTGIDQKELVLDSSKAYRMLNWKAEVDLEEGLKKTIEYWKKIIH